MSDSISDSNEMEVCGALVEWEAAAPATIAHSGTLIARRWLLSIADTELLDEVGTAGASVVLEGGRRQRADFVCSWALRPLPLADLRLSGGDGGGGDPALVLHRLRQAEGKEPEHRQRPALGVARPTRGAPLLLEATPLAHPLLLNAWARTSVAAVAAGGALFLTDAAAAPGTQGAPLFLCREGERRRLVGLVLAPVAYWRGQPFHCSVALALAGIRLEADALLPFHVVVAPHRGPWALPGAVEGVVRVSCGGGWGAGVHLGHGLLLTCAHVVSQAREVEVRWGSAVCGARVLFAVPEGRAFDLALLQLQPPLPGKQRLPPALTLDDRPAVKGEAVVTAGYSAGLGGSCGPATVCAGVVSLSVRGALLTSCRVLAGDSGGAVLRPHTGRLLGLIVCNVATDAGHKQSLHPRVNMAVPAAAIASTLQTFVRTRDASILQELDCKDEAVQRLWRLDARL